MPPVDGIIEMIKKDCNIINDLNVSSNELRYAKERYTAKRDILFSLMKNGYSITTVVGLPYILLIDILRENLLDDKQTRRAVKMIHPLQLEEIASVNPMVSMIVNDGTEFLIEECCICLETKRVYRLSGCKHYLCNNCRNKLLSNNKIKCPYCRATTILK